MIAFGFIENFFFISLALVFVLVLLLVYHFKNRITVAEKKSDSMYGLLTAVVKEIKTLRGVFGLGGGGTVAAPVTEPQSIELKSKTTPEVDVSASSEVSNTFASFVEKTTSVSNVIEPREVITLEFAASDNKIVVSDDDDSDDDDDDSDSDDDSSLSENEEDDPKDDVLEMQFSPPLRLLNPRTDALSEASAAHLLFAVQEIDELPPSQESNDDGILPLEQVHEIDISNILSVSNSDEIEVDLVEQKPEEDQQQPIASHPSPIPSIEQLRKMNINQLKTISSQLGISTDVSKMKKPELISLIRGGLDA